MEETERETTEQQEDKKVKQIETQNHKDEQLQEIWSWGAGTDGQLGTGKLEDEYTPQFLIKLSKSLFSFGSISLLSCGGAHVIALGGKVMSWGRGASGQLGHGDVVANCLYPKLVYFLSSFNISHISAGWNHSGFVSDSGCLFTCGDGSFGQLGHGDHQSYSSPKEVSFFSTKHVEQIACGMRHSLVLLKGNAADKVYGFGSGKRGQLGVSKDKIRSLNIPQPCPGFEAAELVSVIANGDHSAALSADGQLYTWGRGFSSNSDVSIPQSLLSTLTFKQAVLGWNHALLSTSEGDVLMLGGRHHGVLGEPQRITHSNNSSDSGEHNLSKVPGLDGKQVIQIAAGSEHSAIVTDDGHVWTWGWGEHGQLGLGSTSNQTLPHMVDLEHRSRAHYLTSRVYCGSGFTFALNTRPTLSD